MNILILVHDLQLGGAERTALRLGSQWARSGHKVRVLSGEADGPLRALVAAEVELVAADPPVSRGRASKLRLGNAAARLARQRRPDVIFLPGNTYFASAIPLKLRLGRACPPLVAKISNTLSRPDKGRRAQAAYSARFWAKSLFVDHIVAMSPALLEQARRAVPRSRERFTTIAQPVLERSSAVAPRTLTEAPAGRPARLVTAVRLAPQKNLPLLLEAFAIASRELDSTLDIFGEGPLRAEIEGNIGSLGLQNKVRLRGYVPSVGEHLPQFDLFVLASDFEGFPSVLVESLAAGVPVVTTDCSPAIADLVDEPELGRVVPVREPKAFGEAILEVLQRPAPDRQRLSRHVEPFQLDCSAQSYLALFRRVAGGG